MLTRHWFAFQFEQKSAGILPGIALGKRMPNLYKSKESDCSIFFV